MPNCAVKGCKNNPVKKVDSISFHRFPAKPNRNEAWCRVIRQQHNDPFFKSNRFMLVCSVHFKTDDFYKPKCGARRLKRTAIPSIFKVQPSSVKHKQPLKCKTEYAVDWAGSQEEDIMDVDISDFRHSIFDTPPKVVRLGKIINKCVLRNFPENIKNYKLRKQNAKLNKKNESLINIIEELKNKRFITSEIEEALEVTPELAETFRLQVLNAERQNNSSTKTRRRLSYSPRFKKFAMSLNFYTPAGYNYVRRKFNHCLPHPRTLTKWYSSINGEPGFTKESFDKLKLKRENVPENVEGVLMFDEMSIQQAKVWKRDHNVGYVDLGHGNVNKDRQATKSLVLMLVSLKENWKIPLGYFLVDNMSSELLASTLNIGLEKLYIIGVNVNALVCDGCPTNIRALNVLGTNIGRIGDLKTTFPHPTTKEDVPVFFDACHMMKLVRNVLEQKKVLFNGQGQVIRWNFLTRLMKIQTKNKLHSGNKLTARGIYFRNQIMKVRLAVQLLSKSVADALNICNYQLKDPSFSGSDATVEFIQIFSDIFDILNSRRFNQTGFKRAISEKNKTQVFDFIEKAIVYIKSLKLYCKVKTTIKNRNKEPHITIINFWKPVLESQSKVGFLGLIVCMESLKVLYKKNVETDSKLTSISTYRLSQNHLELFFSILRRHGSSDNDPNCIQFKSAYRRALNHLSVKSSFTLNSIPLDNFSILSISSDKAINSTSIRLCGDDEVEEMDNEDDVIYSNNCNFFSKTLDTNSANVDVEIESIVGYIAGWVAKVLSKKLKCETCIGSLLSNERLNFHKMIEFKNMGGLCFPSKDMFKVCLETEKNLRRFKLEFRDKRDFKYFLLKSLKNVKRVDVFSILDSHSMEQPATLNHRLHLIMSIIEKYTNVRKHREFKMENTSKISKRQQSKKLVLFDDDEIDSKGWIKIEPL